MATVFNDNNTLRVCTYNSKGHGTDRVEYMKYLMQKCDILLIQEHWMFESDINSLESAVGNVNVFGVSAMDSNVLLEGRPHGGCALMHNKSLNCLVSPIDTGNPRVCAGCTELKLELGYGLRIEKKYVKLATFIQGKKLKK
jgi:hypothetical protein